MERHAPGGRKILSEEYRGFAIKTCWDSSNAPEYLGKMDKRAEEFRAISKNLYKISEEIKEIIENTYKAEQEALDIVIKHI